MTARLEVAEVSRRFGATVALDGVTLAFQPGEVHGVIGENGAGKSTLMRILAGLLPPDGGRILLDGQPVVMNGPAAATARGIAMIHQELSLVGELSAAENIFLGREPSRAGFVSRGEMRRRAASLLADVGSRVPPGVPVRRLQVADQQMVEIAKALSCRARVLIMDEPTAVLSQRESQALLSLIRRLSADGVTVIYISHLLPEVLSVCSRISVLRDGRLVATVPAAQATERSLAGLMVGRPLEDIFPARREARGVRSAAAAGGAGGAGGSGAGAARLEVRSLSDGGRVREVSFHAGEGEIVGISGLVGSGRTEVAEMVAGLRTRRSGQVLLDGRAFSPRSPAEAMRHGVAYVSEDRARRGLHLAMSCTENVTLPSLRRFGRWFPARRRERDAALRWIRDLHIRCPAPGAAVKTLSGGNQQKFSVAKWLQTEPRVLLLDEPTRGIDLGAKREMYHLISQLALNGMTCVVISSELPELIGLCHRIVVLREGRTVGEMPGEGATEEALMGLAAGVGGGA